MNINYLSTRTNTNTNNNRRRQEHSQTNTDTEDRRQGHHNSLEPITAGPWCMHTNKDLQKYKLELHVIMIFLLKRAAYEKLNCSILAPRNFDFIQT